MEKTKKLVKDFMRTRAGILFLTNAFILNVVHCTSVIIKHIADSNSHMFHKNFDKNCELASFRGVQHIMS